MAPSSNDIRFMVARYSFGLNLFPDGDTSIKRLIKPDFASVIFTGLFVPIYKKQLKRFV